MSSDLFFPYSLPISSIGRPTTFEFLEPEPLLELPPNPYIREMYVLADPRETEFSNCPQMSESSTNTERVLTSEKGQLHVDGGWPLSVDVNEPEERNKYARRQCRDERHLDALRAIVPQASAVLRINGALDIYEPLFEEGESPQYRRVNPAAVAAAEVARSRMLCPWRYLAKDTDSTVRPATLDKSTSSPSKAAFGGKELKTIRFGGASSDELHVADIAYNDPSVVHALHVSCKLSIPALSLSSEAGGGVGGDGPHLLGNTASQARFTCGSDSTSIVVGYCDGFLPARANINHHMASNIALSVTSPATAADMFSYGGGGVNGGISISTSAVGIGSPAFLGGDGRLAAFQQSQAGPSFLSTSTAAAQFNTSLLGVSGGAGPTPTSARRSTAVSPLFRSSGAATSSAASAFARLSDEEGLPNNREEEGGRRDHLSESMRDAPSHQSLIAMLTRAKEEREHSSPLKNEAMERADEEQQRAKERGGDADEQQQEDEGRAQEGKKITTKDPLSRDGVRSFLMNSSSSLSAIRGGGAFASANSSLHSSSWGCAAAMWSTTDPSTHSHLFLSRSGGATAIATSFRDPNIVHGGMGSGILEMWDVRQGPRPVAASGREHSHRDAVTAVQLVTTKATECFSAGLDGYVLFWDTRKLTTPIFEESLELRCPKTGVRYAPTGIDFDPLVGGPLKYLVSTMEGKVLSCARRANRSGDKIHAVHSAHYGACFGASRCRSVPKVFATCGDWSVKLMGDELLPPSHGGSGGSSHAMSPSQDSALFTTPMISSGHVLCGAWHPTRHSIFIIGTSSGYVYFYDFLRTAHGPVMRVRASSCAVCHIEPHVTGRTLAATDSNGEVHIVSLPSALYEPAVDERSLIVAKFERDYARERQRLYAESSASIYTSPTVPTLRSGGGTNTSPTSPPRFGKGKSERSDETLSRDEEEPSKGEVAPLLIASVSEEVEQVRSSLRPVGAAVVNSESDRSSTSRSSSSSSSTDPTSSPDERVTSANHSMAKKHMYNNDNNNSKINDNTTSRKIKETSVAEMYLRLVGVAREDNPYAAPDVPRSPATPKAAGKTEGFDQKTDRTVREAGNTSVSSNMRSPRAAVESQPFPSTPSARKLLSRLKDAAAHR